MICGARVELGWRGGRVQLALESGRGSLFDRFAQVTGEMIGRWRKQDWRAVRCVGLDEVQRRPDLFAALRVAGRRPRCPVYGLTGGGG